jgi:hypothetical protein
MSVIQNEWRAQGSEASSNRKSRSDLEKTQNLLWQLPKVISGSPWSEPT